MQPEIEHLNYLINRPTLRNFCSYDFLERHNFQINLANYICYTIGNSNNQRYINAFQFIGECSCHKLKNYYIRWWNTAEFDEYNKYSHFDSIQFWVHSGMTLRKNFFIYDDRMSLFRTTFIFDPLSKLFFRLSYIIAYIFIPFLSSVNNFIFTTPEKHYFCRKITQKENKRKTHIKIDPQINELQKKFSKIIKNKNYSRTIRKHNIKLFEELNNFIKIKDAGTSSL